MKSDKERLIEIIIKYGCPNCHIPKHKETLAEAILKEYSRGKKCTCQDKGE